MFDYPTELEIAYSTDAEYRRCIRSLIKDKNKEISHSEVGFDADADPDETITNDEQDYDEISASNFLKEVFRDTSTNAELMALYKSAAGVMFSEDENTGFVILMAYDNLEVFHRCLCVFYKTGTCLCNPYYTELARKFIC
jgi:hypothetical protein